MDGMLRVMPILTPIARDHWTFIENFFKKLQKCTRFLQALCTHTKVLQDTKLTHLTPQLRKGMETLILRVQDMLQDNEMDGSFSVATLRHRNVDGTRANTSQLISDDDDESNEESEDDDESRNS